jgi:hypothetical protein
MDTSLTALILYACDWLADGQNAIGLGIVLAGLADIIMVCFLAKTVLSFQRDHVADVMVIFGQP